MGFLRLRVQNAHENLTKGSPCPIRRLTQVRDAAGYRQKIATGPLNAIDSDAYLRIVPLYAEYPNNRIDASMSYRSGTGAREGLEAIMSFVLASRYLMAKPHQLYTLLQIRDITPPIWRRIQVDGSDSLRKLHHILQAALGWSDSHLHAFEIDDKTYAMFDVDDVLDTADPDNTFDDRKAKLEKVAYPGLNFVYEYDFGDGWEHDIIVEKVESIEGEPRGCAHIVAGERACPPDDVGGPFGYQVLLDTLQQQPESEAANDYRRWAGSDVDAELFDRRAANAALLRMAWNRWGGK